MFLDKDRPARVTFAGPLSTWCALWSSGAYFSAEFKIEERTQFQIPYLMNRSVAP